LTIERRFPDLRSIEADLIRDTVENDRPRAGGQPGGCDFSSGGGRGVKLVPREPVRTIRTTIHGTEVILDAAHRFGKPVLITSSSEFTQRHARAVSRGG